MDEQFQSLFLLFENLSSFAIKIQETQ